MVNEGGEKCRVHFGNVAGSAHLKDECAGGFEGGEDCAERGVAGGGGAQDPVESGVGDAGVVWSVGRNGGDEVYYGFELHCSWAG